MADATPDTLGIHGPLQNVIADANNAKAVIMITHEVPPPGEVTSTTVTQEQLRKCMGVPHANLHNVHSMEITTNAKQSTIMSGVTVKSGDGAPLPTTERHCAMIGDSMAAAHVVAMPQSITSSGEMKLKALSTDKHGFKPPDALSEEEKQRNVLNACFYAHNSDAPDNAALYKHTITAERDGVRKTAIPLTDKVTPDHGGLTAVASRCLKQQGKGPKALAADATVVKMPHRVTGEITEHLLASTASVDAMAAQIKANTKVCGTFASGVTIDTHGMVEDGDYVPGQKVTHQIVFHRTPTGESHEVTYVKDVAPQGTAPAVALPANGDPAMQHESDWHAAMFATGKGMASTVANEHEDAAENGGGADDGDGN